ncbi:MAG: efflux transporter outer membrane subunit [Chlamydiales bacterium]|nr:efflux transporter outer membrane subunit [Chlamydiales bacterium]
MRFLVLLIFTACTLHPRYERPDVPMPEAWRTELPSREYADLRWWRQLGDPILNELVENSMKQNQELKVAISRIDQFCAELGVVRSKLLPQLELLGGFTRQKISDSVLAAPQGQDLFNVFGFLFQPSYWVDIWGEVRSAAQAARFDYLASIDAAHLVTLQLTSSVVNTYVQLRQADAQLAISMRTLYTRQEGLDQAKLRFDLGLTSQMPVEQALSEVEVAQVRVELYTKIIAEAENLLSLLLGEPSHNIARGAPLDQLSMPASIPAEAPADIICMRPDVQQMEHKLMAANANIGVARAKFLPKIMADGSWGSEASRWTDFLRTPATVWSWGGDFVQQIFTGGRLISNLRLSQAKKKEAIYEYAQTLLNGVREVNDALIAHKIALETEKTQKARVEALAQYRYLSYLRYQEGENDYLTFLDAERHLFQGQLDYEDAKGNSFYTLTAIFESLGSSWYPPEKPNY